VALSSVVSPDRALLVDRQAIYDLLQLDKPAWLGEYWRLWTVTLLHGDLLHLFNMYAFWLVGPIVERWYGGSASSPSISPARPQARRELRLGGDVPAVGASGAIFGLFGLLLAAGRLHNPVDRQSRALVGQIGMLILLNLAFGFASGGSIDNAAHLGGLVSGLWLGALILPTGVPTLSSLWQRPSAGPTPSRGQPGGPVFMAAIGIGVVAIVVAPGSPSAPPIGRRVMVAAIRPESTPARRSSSACRRDPGSTTLTRARWARRFPRGRWPGRWRTHAQIASPARCPDRRAQDRPGRTVRRRGRPPREARPVVGHGEDDAVARSPATDSQTPARVPARRRGALLIRLATIRLMALDRRTNPQPGSGAPAPHRRGVRRGADDRELDPGGRGGGAEPLGRAHGSNSIASIGSGRSPGAAHRSTAPARRPAPAGHSPIARAAQRISPDAVPSPCRAYPLMTVNGVRRSCAGRPAALARDRAFRARPPSR
jgi:membrane associated rhomboid family serine protease